MSTAGINVLSFSCRKAAEMIVMRHPTFVANPA